MNVQATFAATIVDEWARCGVRHAVVSPGSRSTPLVVALDEHPEIEVHVRLDERAAAFFALGLGLATGMPAVVVTTSGTAAAEPHPAVVEADLARVPLIVCTADRPPELQGVGAPQTIDQSSALYGKAPRLYADPGVASSESESSWRPFAGRVFAAALHHPQGRGPVHVNLPFREPLVGTAGPLPPPRSSGGPWLQVARRSPAAPTSSATFGARRGVFVAGAGCGDLSTVYALAASLGWPVLADPRAGGRIPSQVLVAATDSILASERFVAAHKPDAVVRLGAPPASRRLASWVASSSAPVVVVDDHWPWSDPEGVASEVVGTLPAVTAPAEREPPDTDWLAHWAAAESAAQQAIDEVLADDAGLSEPALARSLYRSLNSTATMFVGSSMPVRDLEWFAKPSFDPPRVLANRGANGIDGVTSTALGVATGSPAGSVTALVGDLSFLHDLSALVWQRDCAPPAATMVVVDNAGGGIFSFLPQAGALPPARFEKLFGTPQSVDIVAVVRAFGFGVSRLESVADVEKLVGSAPQGLRVAVAHTNRAANAALHGEINANVVRRVEEALELG